MAFVPQHLISSAPCSTERFVNRHILIRSALLLTLKDQIPARAKDNAWRYIAKIVEDIKRRISDDLRRSVTSALNRSGLIRRLGELRSSGVNVVVLLAISDSGKPIYDENLARKVAALDIPCFACPPERLPELLENALKHRSFAGFV